MTHGYSEVLTFTEFILDFFQFLFSRIRPYPVKKKLLIKHKNCYNVWPGTLIDAEEYRTFGVQ